MNFQLGSDEPQLAWTDQLRMRDGYAVKFAIDLGGPEIEKRFELRETRRGIVFLPDIALKQRRMVWKPVENLSGRQAEPCKLSLEAVIARYFPFGHVAISLELGDWAPSLERTMIQRDSFPVHHEDWLKRIVSKRILRVLAIYAKAMSTTPIECAPMASAICVWV